MTADASGLRAKVRRFGRTVGDRAADGLLGEVVDIIPVDTGFMRNQTKVVSVGGQRWRIFSAADYSSYTDTGSRAHVIRPRTAKALRFKVGSATVFAMKVNHPGTEGTRWWSDTVTRRGWIRQLRQAVKTSPMV